MSGGCHPSGFTTIKLCANNLNWVALQNKRSLSVKFKSCQKQSFKNQKSEIKSQKRCRSVIFAWHRLKANAIRTLALQAPVYEMHNVDLVLQPTQEFRDQIRCIDIFISLAWQLASTALNLPLIWSCCRRHFLALGSFLLKLGRPALCHCLMVSTGQNFRPWTLKSFWGNVIDAAWSDFERDDEQNWIGNCVLYDPNLYLLMLGWLVTHKKTTSQKNSQLGQQAGFIRPASWLFTASKLAITDQRSWLIVSRGCRFELHNFYPWCQKTVAMNYRKKSEALPCFHLFFLPEPQMGKCLPSASEFWARDRHPKIDFWMSISRPEFWCTGTERHFAAAWWKATMTSNFWIVNLTDFDHRKSKP